MEQRKQTEEQVRRSEKSTLELALKTERRAVLVVNTRSRRGKQLYADAKRLLESRGITLDAACSARHAKTMTRVMQEAIAEGQRFIIVGGGDGTLSSVLQHFAYRPVVLGILPLGTANSFARTLGIPVELEAAVDVLVTGKVVDVDIGRIGESYFSTVASVGLAAQVARHMPKRLKKWLGRIAYLLVAAMQLRRFGSFRCTVTANGRQSCFDALEYAWRTEVIREACSFRRKPAPRAAIS